jgi:hypothetical protein
MGGDESVMSNVISFRLSSQNSREAQACDVLKIWISKGYSVRYVVTEALISLKDNTEEPMKDIEFQKISTALERITQFINVFETEKSLGFQVNNTDVAKSNLNESFLLSVKKVIKPGLRLD